MDIKFTPAPSPLSVNTQPGNPIADVEAKVKAAEEILKDEEAISPPTVEAALALVKKNSKGMQFKHSLEFVQGGTNMTLDRMLSQFDIVLADVYLTGYVDALKFARSLTTK